ncbi:NTP transferase domain-containing protein [Thalassococcus sp. S3]|uniref:nucleotidyltransferase family protein n=1 Tax=Thalassococcus sp. S3 TaxID=2017482 RepID=UPI0010247E43|nr:nucleotidyltransferase family protein [Thalassococcus sp. S3]QBF32679.1 molybdopterin-binding protein [Thalassococcus sp. S3]
MRSVTAILLAAGLSRRMGAWNKLLLPVDGEPMVRRVARTYLAAIDTPLTVVTGHDAEKVRAALSGLATSFTHNPDFASGQPTSVAAGVREAPNADLLLIGLADQPKLTPHDLTALIAAHRQGDAAKITIPIHDGARGNPIVVPRMLRPRLLDHPDRPGCMHFTRQQPEQVQIAFLPAPGFYADIDTPDDYAAHVQTLGEPIP